MESLAAVLLILACVGTTYGYPYGAPRSACNDMFPVGHNVSSQISDPPYTITTNSTTYANNANISVTLTPTENAGYYEGVFIQARRAQCGTGHSEPVGTFLIDNSTVGTYLKIMNCGFGQKNAISHSNKMKKKVLTFLWMPPTPSTGTIYFRGTFVKETDEFWTTVSSDYVNNGMNTPSPEKCSVRTSLSGASSPISVYAHYIVCVCSALIWIVTR